MLLMQLNLYSLTVQSFGRQNCPLIYLCLKVNLVCCLLKLPDFSDDVRNLESKGTRRSNPDRKSTFSHCKRHDSAAKTSHHPHLGKVDQVILCVVWCSLLNERQVGEVHPQIWHTGRIAAGGRNTRHPNVLHVCLIEHKTAVYSRRELTSSKPLAGF